MFDPGHIRVGTIRQSAHAGACREQPRGLLVLAAAQGQVRDPDEYPRDQECVPRLRRGLECRDAVLASLAEIVGQVAEQVVCYRADIRPLRFVAQHGCHDVELLVCLLGVAVPAREFRLREGQLSQRIRPGDPFRAPLRLGDGGRAGVLVAQQPVQLRLSRP